MNSFRAVIELWGSREAMAADLGAASGKVVASRKVSKWWQRNSIPSAWWAALLDTEVARAAGVSSELLTALAARETAEAAE